MRLLGIAENDRLTIDTRTETQKRIRTDHFSIHEMFVLRIDVWLRSKNLANEIFLTVNSAFLSHAFDRKLV
jgi:hypothetical protein